MSENNGGGYCRGPGRADKAIAEAIEKGGQMEGEICGNSTHRR